MRRSDQQIHLLLFVSIIGMTQLTQEEKRLEENRNRTAHWRRWGPYLSERQWGTVREDYSSDGSAWDYFTHDQSHYRAYRWGEDGIGGISDNHQRLCFALALWNGKDPILKERIFGLSGNQGNHGEDVKEYYFYLDSTPTHSFMNFLYKYPQSEFPYGDLIQENQQRGRLDFEYELLDTGIFNENRYFDVFVEYAKNTTDDVLIKIHAINRGPEAAQLNLLPTLWFRNDWSWDDAIPKPGIKFVKTTAGCNVLEAEHRTLGKRWFYCSDAGELLFTENETNFEYVFGSPNVSPYTKDGIHQYVVQGNREAVNPARTGTKVSANYTLNIAPGETKTIQLRLSDAADLGDPLGAEFDRIFQTRKNEADEFYNSVIPEGIGDDMRNVQRQAFGGLMWTKQFFYYIIEDWIKGDPASPPPPESRKNVRNYEWMHLSNEDIISMPDKWEYPWFAAWDLAFHVIPIARIDPEFAKRQMDLMTREWYMHPNGQLPAYEWNFSDVNPPVHAWATWKIYKMEQELHGRKDRQFLERVFQKLLMNFTWWVNKKDQEGNNVFEGGFLGLDNIGVFDRSAPLPSGGSIEQADGTSWMAMYSLNMLHMAIELAQDNPVYEDIASKFFEHFLYIAAAMDRVGILEDELWDEDDAFFYDLLNMPGFSTRMKVRSMVGLIPLYAVEVIDPKDFEKIPEFKKRMDWFLEHRKDLQENIACMDANAAGDKRLLAIAPADKVRSILQRMLDESEFFGPHGIRALSRVHLDDPYIFYLEGKEYRVSYEPAESSTGLFGGNSNWRGPVWFPVNYMLMESMQKLYDFFGDELKVECPTGSGNWVNLEEVAAEISRRLITTFTENEAGNRPVYGGIPQFQNDPHWHNYILFYEYFHGDNGAGIGASHQTGWTGLVADLIQQYGVQLQSAGKIPAAV